MPDSKLFVPERDHGIDAGSAPGRNVAGEDCAGDQNREGGGQCQRVVGLQAEEEGLQKFSGLPYCRGANGKANGGE